MGGQGRCEGMEGLLLHPLLPGSWRSEDQLQFVASVRIVDREDTDLTRSWMTLIPGAFAHCQETFCPLKMFSCLFLHNDKGSLWVR